MAADEPYPDSEKVQRAMFQVGRVLGCAGIAVIGLLIIALITALARLALHLIFGG